MSRTRLDRTRLSSKGQVVLPKTVRQERNWGPGTEFLVEAVKDGVLLRPVKPVQTTSARELLGCTGYQGPARSLAQMQEAIARGVKDRHARGRH
jgi:AbrB family looped-hinge helix DNA binding protein